MHTAGLEKWAQLGDVSNHKDNLVVWVWELELAWSRVEGRRMKVNIMTPRCHHGVPKRWEYRQKM